MKIIKNDDLIITTQGLQSVCKYQRSFWMLNDLIEDWGLTLVYDGKQHQVAFSSETARDKAFDELTEALTAI